MAENPILMGVLVDVSASLNEIDTERLLDDGRLTLIPSIYSHLSGSLDTDSLSDHEHCVFTVGMGGYFGSGVFDIIGTIAKQMENEKIKDEMMGHIAHAQSMENFDSIIEHILDIIDAENTKLTSKCVNANDLESKLSCEHLFLLLNKLRHNLEFRDKFIATLSDLGGLDEEYQPSCDDLQSAVYKVLSSSLQEDIRTYTASDAFGILQNFVKKSLIPSAGSLVMSVLLQGKHRILPEVVKVLLKIVKPYIFGEANLFASLTKMLDIFSKQEFSNFDKYCVIISPGRASDDVDDTIVHRFKEEGVNIFSCVVADNKTIQPRKIFSGEESQWDNTIRFMFRFSSDIATRLLPYGVLRRKKWNIDSKSKTCKMFLQINHPDNVSDIVDMMHNFLCCKDSLSQVLMSPQISEYIFQEGKGFDPRTQKGAACFANAAATIIHLAVMRYNDNVSANCPIFGQLKENIISRYGKGCTRTLSVLKVVCKQYNIQCNEVTASEAIEAVSSKRPVLASFSLSDSEWEILLKFYENYPRGILGQDVIDLSKRKLGRLFEHSVLLTSVHGHFLRFMNSWGSDWADAGFFKVKNYLTLKMKFYDVVTVKDNENVMNKTTIARVQYQLLSTEYVCKLCQAKSFLFEYTGTLTSFVCPKCDKIFDLQDQEESKLVQSNYIASILC